MRLSRVQARNLREGDKLVVTVERVLGVQGRKPRYAAPLMRLCLSDGWELVVREDERLEVLRGG